MGEELRVKWELYDLHPEVNNIEDFFRIIMKISCTFFGDNTRFCKPDRWIGLHYPDFTPLRHRKSALQDFLLKYFGKIHQVI